MTAKTIKTKHWLAGIAAFAILALLVRTNPAAAIISGIIMVWFANFIRKRWFPKSKLPTGMALGAAFATVAQFTIAWLLILFFGVNLLEGILGVILLPALLIASISNFVIVYVAIWIAEQS
jgi:uncharacterized protein YybS (DUF2232 family)